MSWCDIMPALEEYKVFGTLCFGWELCMKTYGATVECRALSAASVSLCEVSFFA